MKNFIFDVDGTLTPSRSKIDPEFSRWFLTWCLHNCVHLVTGSDHPKTLEQLNFAIIETIDYCFNCCGNDVYFKGRQIFKSGWVLPDDAKKWLEDRLMASHYPHRYGNHLEQRTGAVNFSIVGRNAVGDQRRHYYEWDLKFHERANIANNFNALFPDLIAYIGGETGLDIFPKGKDKSQALGWLKGEYVFFGDRCDPQGNDYSIAQKVKEKGGIVYHVKSWEETRDILQQNFPLQ